MEFSLLVLCLLDVLFGTQEQSHLNIKLSRILMKKLATLGRIPALILGLSLGVTTVVKADYVYNLNLNNPGGFGFGTIAAAGDLVGTLTAITFDYSAPGYVETRGGGGLWAGEQC